jgi:hypothetical protein
MLSAVSNSGNASLAQWLQSIQKSHASQLASGTSVFNASNQPGATPAAAQIQLGKALHGSASCKSGGTNFFSQLRQTVTNALTIAQNSGSGEDPNQVVQSAIASLLKNMGMGSNASAMGTLAAAESNGQGPEQAGSPSFTEGFQKLLASANITPQQFKSDFLSAVRQVQTGSGASPIGNILDVAG